MRIVGNLDVEVTWARMDAAARRARGEKAPSPDDPRFALPEAVMRKISAAATLMRVLAPNDQDAVLWTPRPVDPSRMPEVAWWMPKVRIESGPIPETADIWWGEPTEIAALVNHRFFLWDVKLRNREPRLPGAFLIWTVEGLERAAADLASRDSRVEWVAKAPLSAAGRLRVRGAGGVLTDAARAQARRLLDLQGVLMFEPWMKRVMDFGVCGNAIHRLEVDRAGRFTGIADTAIGLDAQQGFQIGTAVASIGEALRAADYTGCFGIDGFVYGDGASLQCVSEINARMTFGAVASKIIDWARDALVSVAADEPVTLRFGRGAPPPTTIPLLLPGADDDTSAWLELPVRA